jgi:TolA-binding protein
MFCSHCGAQVDASYKYCPACGSSISAATMTFSPPSEDSTETTVSTSETQIVKKKPMPFWFKLVALLAVLALIGVTAGILFTESWVDVVDHQLEALRQQDIAKAYYAYTSKDFQSATSLDQFRNFVEAYPVFLNNQSAHFTQRSIDRNIGTLKGNLTSNDHVNTPIEYKLIKEDDKWKILSIRLLKPENIQNAKEADRAEDLIEVAKAQLKNIQDQKLTEAYQNYSSKEFKEATSEEAFREFIKRYPILSDYHIVSFHKPTIRNGVGTLSVILQSEQIAAYVKYYLIYEDQKWKIWSMRILSPSESQEKKEQGKENKQAKRMTRESLPGPMSFGTISLGDQVDEQGQIKHPLTSFPSDLKDLYVDIEVKNGRKGSMVYLTLQHLESGSSIPAKAAIEENGDTMLMSVFSPPESGWPKGHYKLVVTTSSGLSDVVDFEIE